jgi:hypothetical protein
MMRSAKRGSGCLLLRFGRRFGATAGASARTTRVFEDARRCTELSDTQIAALIEVNLDSLRADGPLS